MEGRARNSVRTERSRVRVAPPPPPAKHHQSHQLQQLQRRQCESQQLQGSAKVSVVYYLCRSRQLEHPHFVEVPLSSPEGLHLKDVINRLNSLRGKGMAAMYSWSCKRSYKNGFVWHDLAEEDIILPANGMDEYVLKGSELLDASPPDRSSPIRKTQNTKQLQEDEGEQRTALPPRSHDSSPSSSSTASVEEITPRLPPPPQHQPPLSSRCLQPPADERELSSPALPRQSFSAFSSRDSALRPPPPPPPRTTNAATQTDPPAAAEQRAAPDTPLIPRPSSSTLEALIRADAAALRATFDEEPGFVPSAAGAAKQKASHVLMQLITCGSLSVKDHRRSFGLVPTYRTGMPPSQVMTFDGSAAMLGEMDGIRGSRRSTGSKMEGVRAGRKQCYSGSLVERRRGGEMMEGGSGGGGAVLKRSSSYGADRRYKSPNQDNERNQNIDSLPPRPVKVRQSQNSTIASLSPRVSLEGIDHIGSTSTTATPTKSNKRFVHVTSGNGCSTTSRSLEEEKEKVLKKIEES